MLAVILSACSSTVAAAPPVYRPPSPASCAWFTSMAAPGQVVNVTATGHACQDRSLIGWLAADTDRPWMSEGYIPGSFGTLLAQLSGNGTTVGVWFTGPSTGQAAPLAGKIADALASAGWAPVLPPTLGGP